jgi:ribonucleoside-diphosphate reductase alpha chain
MDGEKLTEVNPYFEQALKDSGSWSQTLMDEVTKRGSVKGLDYLPEDLRDVFVTAMDVSPAYHLKMQAAFQKYTDNAVSKTVNLPGSATQEDIRNIYWMAYEQGCKGVTVYRDGCKSVQVLCVDNGEGAKKEPAAGKSIVRQRPDVVYGFTQKVNTGLGVLYLTVNEVEGKPFEVFATIGKSGRSITAKAEAIGRLVSLALRSGVKVEEIVGQLKGIGGEHPVFREKGLIHSIPDAVAWVFEQRYLQGKRAKPGAGNGNDLAQARCPECDDVLVFEEGCHICKACGFTKCG